MNVWKNRQLVLMLPQRSWKKKVCSPKFTESSTYSPVPDLIAHASESLSTNTLENIARIELDILDSLRNISAIRSQAASIHHPNRIRARHNVLPQQIPEKPRPGRGVSVTEVEQAVQRDFR
ncbi:hypothetical protein PAPYR_4038 [Paratrimastix pyriformis]|uniref:Uncharacterized protein n=1 Tax=Paratrimastix pyriformis TaxID=342808 RepID=A0ABQ8UNU3_9EUKA|nr:hypothetical protein PAPYR_4038 [Paratrimastix pyriformis]